MREILFRGKPTERFADYPMLRPDLFWDGWVYGSLVVCNDRYYICTYAECSNRTTVNNAHGTMIEVIPETVGQYTGVCDKIGKKIFEGDIVSAYMDFGPAGFIENVVDIGYKKLRGYRWEYFDMDSIRVIGNIHDNPELLKGDIK